MHPQKAHRDLHKGFADAIAAHAKNMPSIEILAVAAQFLGQLIAMQDASLGTAAVMEVVRNNIDIGNAEAIGVIVADSGGKN